MEVLVVNKEEVDEILTMDECIRIMSDTFEAQANGKLLQPLRSAMKLPFKKGLLGMMPGYGEEHLQDELGDLLAGKRQGRKSSQDVTLFKSLGLAIEDVSAGFVVYQEAKKRNLGTSVVI